MAYIYQITNDINGKIYIGKTERNIQQRFREHCQESIKERSENRPLYRAMRKYGIEHFHIQLIEETDNPEERERFWIEQKGSFKNGYNATLGGDGKKYLDYDLLINTYKEIKNIHKVAELMSVDESYLGKILKNNNIEIKSTKEINRENLSKNVEMIDLKSNELIKCFSSLGEAAEYLVINKKTTSIQINGIVSHITHVCSGKRKSAYGYKWRYLEKNN